jgi:homocysteine S-methyltransferase
VTRTPKQSRRASASPSRTAAARPAPSRFVQKLAAGDFVALAELAPPIGGTADTALRDAAVLKAAGCDAVLIGASTGARPQVSPTSLAVLVEQRVEGLEAVLTVFTWEKSVMSLQADLLGAYAFGVRHVLCRTGTPLLPGDHVASDSIWDVDSVGLVQLLRQMNEGRDHNDIPLAQPTSFVIGGLLSPTEAHMELDLEDARRKVEAGVDFLITPPVYDLDGFEAFLDAAGVPVETPMLLGVMPLRDFNHAEYLQQEIPGVLMPDEVVARMWRAGPDGAIEGLAIARELIAEARKRPRFHGVLLSSSDGNPEELTVLLQEIASQAGAWRANP